MKLDLQIDGTAAELDISAALPACRFRLDGDGERAAEVETPEPGVYSVLIEGRSYDAFVEETPDGLVVTIDGRRFEIDVADRRAFTRRRAGRGAEGVVTVASPMPGKVVRVLVSAGDQVEAGQGVVVVEAMKMQNEMKAARAGRVTAVAAREGATVAAGEVLATIE